MTFYFKFSSEVHVQRFLLGLLHKFSLLDQKLVNTRFSAYFTSLSAHYIKVNPLDPTDFHPICGNSPGFSKFFHFSSQDFDHVYKSKDTNRSMKLLQRHDLSCIE